MHGAGSAAAAVGSRAMRTPRTLLLPLIALPLAGCALLPVPGPGRSDIAAPPTAPGPSAAAEADPVSEEDLMRAAVVDYRDYLVVAGEVAMGRADPSVLSAHLDAALLAEETSLNERLHAAGLRSVPSRRWAR